jgi:hypothetical protein
MPTAKARSVVTRCQHQRPGVLLPDADRKAQEKAEGDITFQGFPVTEGKIFW